MNDDNILVCGTRKKSDKYKDLVFMILDKRVHEVDIPDSIIEGCCPDSADAYAEEWAKQYPEIIILHHPSTPGNYLQRNIEMISKANLVIAFWDGYSYGTAHTIANAVMRGIPLQIIYLGKNVQECDKR